MATDLSTIADSKLSMVWRTQYVTEALNRKSKSERRGIMRGFQAVPNAGGNDMVDLLVDPVFLDSTMNLVGLTGDFSVTYRETATVLLDLSGLPAARHYIAAIPGYAVGAATAAKIVAYDETEFEAGAIDTASGVLLFAVNASGNTAVLNPYDIMTAGCSSTGTADKEFISGHQKFGAASNDDGYQLVIDSVPNLGRWNSKLQYDLTLSTAAFDKSDFRQGNGSLKFTGGGVGSTVTVSRVGEVIDVWAKAPGALGPECKIIVQYWYKTDGSYSQGAGARHGPNLVLFDGAGGILPMNVLPAAQAPTYASAQVPAGINQPWQLRRMEWTVPQPALPSQYTGATLILGFDHEAGSLYLGRVQVFISRQPGDVEADSSLAESAKSANFVSNIVLASGLDSDQTVYDWDASQSSFDFGRPQTFSTATDIQYNMGPSSGIPNNWRFYCLTGNYELNAVDEFVVASPVTTDTLKFRGPASSNDIILDTHKLQLEDAYTYNTGTPGAVVGDVPVAEQATSGQMSKAWARVTTDGIGGITLVKGFNISDVQFALGNLACSLTFATAMADTDYIVIVQQSGGGTGSAATNTATTQTTIAIDGGINLATNAVTFSVVVFGED